EPQMGLIYLNNKDEKRVVYLEEIVKFCDATLKKVLSEAPRAWFERLSKALFDLDFKGSKSDPSLFIYSCGHMLLYTLVYVDDIIVTGNNKGTIDKIICQRGFAFALKDLRLLNYFLCIEIVPHMYGIILSQKKYILEILQSVGLSNCSPVSFLMVTSSSLILDDSIAFSNPVKYQQVVGSLQYVTLSRPDIGFAVNKVCQYMHASTENHWSAVKRILRYLHGTVEHGMLIRRSSGSTLQAFTDVLWKGNPDTSLEAFSDADWAGDSDDQRSTGDLLYILVKTLYLRPLVNNLLSASPFLETLYLVSCYGFGRIDITSKSVKKLVIGGYYEPEDQWDLAGIVEINAPHILSLHILMDFLLWKVVLLNVSSLVEAELNYWKGGHYETTKKEWKEEMLKGLIL
nr:hypothetical protein [Tanacetum cinerariifolium]